MVREGRVLISSATDPDFGAGYYVTAYEVGAIVSGGFYPSTTINVDAGHGFAIGDRLIVGAATTYYRRVTNTTATTLTLNSSLSPTVGDILVNLGPDLGPGTPTFQYSGAAIYDDPDYTTLRSGSTVTTDANGRYRYYHKGIGIWELVRDSTGVPFAIYTDVPSSARQAGASNVRNMNEYATGGVGTAASPWTGWSEYCVEGYTIRFPAGYYSVSTLPIPITTSNAVSQTAIIGDGSGISVITITSATGQFRVYGSGSGTRVLDGVRVEGLTIQAGANNTSTGLVSFENFDIGCFAGDIRVDPTSSYYTTVGYYLLNCENCHFGMLEARGWSATDAAAGNIRTGLKIYTDDGIQRGNIHFNIVHLTNVTTGLSVSSSSGSLDNLYFGVFKAVNSGTVVNGTNAIVLAGNAEQISFGDLHMEVFANGLTATSVENIVVHNGLASQIHNVANNAGAAFTISNGDGGLIRSRIDNVYNGFVLSGTTTRYWIQRMTTGTVTGVYYTDSSSGGNVQVSGAGILSNFTFSGRLLSTGGFSIGTRVAGGTIATGVLTLPASPTSNNLTVDTEASAASDDLDTISGGSDGDIIMLSAVNDARTVVVKNNTGNIKCGADRSLDNSLDIITLQKVGSNWLQVAFSDNGA